MQKCMGLKGASELVLRQEERRYSPKDQKSEIYRLEGSRESVFRREEIEERIGYSPKGQKSEKP